MRTGTVDYRLPGVVHDRKRRAVAGVPLRLLASLRRLRKRQAGDNVIQWRGKPVASIKRAFDTAGLTAGSVPVVGWGNSKDTAEEVRDGYDNAAAWQYPSAQGFMPVALLSLAASGEPIGYDIHTFSLYDKSSVGPILKLYSK